MAQAVKRIQKELELINDDYELKELGITAGPIDECDIFKWEASISGPEDSPY